MLQQYTSRLSVRAECAVAAASAAAAAATVVADDCM